MERGEWMSEAIAIIEDYQFDDAQRNIWGGRLRLELCILGKRQERIANLCKFMKILNNAGIPYATHNDTALFNHERA